MKILVIEDSRLLASSIKSQLNRFYIVDIVHSGKQALEQVHSVEYAVIVLDLGLPDMDGFEVCAELRRRNLNVPILVLSGQRTAEMRVRLLETGADDYMTKPFDNAELQARIMALVRRAKGSSSGRELRVADLVMDLNRHKVSRAGKQIALRRKEFDILQYLMQNRGQTVSREMIFNHVWESGKGGWNNTVDVHIKHLRDKIDRPYHKKLIKTAYGLGYAVDETG